jgi:hypothetical protein
MNPVFYVCLCVAVPALWGIVSYFAFGAIRRKREAKTDGPPPIDYSI